MDSANKRNAVVAETTQGTIVSTPPFKNLRDISIGGAPVRNSSRSPERSSTRAATHMVTGLNQYTKSISMPWLRDAGTDLLWEAALWGAFATNTLKQASTVRPFTLEEMYEGGATDFYRRLQGCVVNGVAISWRLGEAGSLTFDIMAMSETTATTALAGATYASPTPDHDPVSTVDITVTTLFGLTTPKLVGLQMSLNNNCSPIYKFGSADPQGIAVGQFDLSGSVDIYFESAAQYTDFITRQTGETFDLVFGSVSGGKDQITLNEVDVYNPSIGDPGPTGQHIATIPFMARYDTSAATAMSLLRNVA